MKKIFCLALAIIGMTFTLGGCDFFQGTPSVISSYDFSEMRLVQLEKPYEGQPLITVETSLGTFKAVLYPEYAPNIINNFTKRIKEGFYTHKSIFAIMNEAYFLTGANNEEGTSGLTDDGNPIANEYSVNLWPFKGALMSFYGGETGFGDSRFFVVGNVPFSEEDAEELRSIKSESSGETAAEQLVPEELIQAFIKNECVVGLSGVYTVFGQTIEGFDVLDKLLVLPSDEETSKPLEDVFIEKIELSEYKSADFE